MPTTSNFGWNTPADTDLVKDGALAIRTLGNNIDASLVDLKGGTTNQVLAKNSNTDLDFKWVETDDTNAIQNAIVDARGDLIAASAADTPARLAVGNNGESLVADSTTTTGLRWQGNFAAGKNKIVNGDFAINQRAFTSATTTETYGFDRWTMVTADGTVTYSAQTFTPGTAPVAGYEAANFARILTTGQTLASAGSRLVQRVEDVKTFANQTVTVSFWAKAASGTPKVTIEVAQNFGSGGSPSTTVNTYGGQVTLSTSWTRYSVSFAVPTISGKTIGTTANTSFLQLSLWVSAGSNFDARLNSLGIQSNTFDFWGVQVEAGSVATPFSTATGTLAGELMAAQRYYWRGTATNVYGALAAPAIAANTTSAAVLFRAPVTMRTSPSSVEYANLGLNDTNAVTALTNLTITRANPDFVDLTATVAAGLTQYRPYYLVGNNNANAYLGLSAEL